jgi:hypothetical protein
MPNRRYSRWVDLGILVAAIALCGLVGAVFFLAGRGGY